MNVLIVGSNGQLGRELLDTQPVWADVVALSKSDLDITHASQVDQTVSATKPAVIINAAAYTKVDLAETNSESAFQINETGVHHLARAAKEHGAKLVHISTDFVFSGDGERPYSPADSVAPISVYGRSKLAGEEALHATLPLDTLIIRTSWVYSIHGHNFVKTMLKLMREGRDLRVVNDQRGSPTWAKGLAQTIWQLIKRDEFGKTLHWSDAGITSWYEFSLEIMNAALREGILKAPVRITGIPGTEYPTPAARPKFSALDCQETYAIEGVRSQPWQQALAKMIHQFKETEHV